MPTIPEDIAIKKLAIETLTGLVLKDFEERIAELGYTYRAKQSFSNVQNAVRKARKHGNYKTEYELRFLEIYLKRDILKKIR